MSHGLLHRVGQNCLQSLRRFRHGQRRVDTVVQCSIASQSVGRNTCPRWSTTTPKCSGATRCFISHAIFLDQQATMAQTALGRACRSFRTRRPA
mmetsp:Transcript_40729/g.88091  ORF Transcript_40729/g.88091 Transcript_40729/m.88091 type:complete len:94 (-) Transcript_40729:225-506(-)